MVVAISLCNTAQFLLIDPLLQDQSLLFVQYAWQGDWWQGLVETDADASRAILLIRREEIPESIKKVKKKEEKVSDQWRLSLMHVDQDTLGH